MEPTGFKMEDFMDVVYKCKFCPYSCTQSPEMGLHVKEKHLKQPTYSSHSDKTKDVSIPAENYLYNVGTSTHLTVPINIQESDDVLTFTQADGQAYMDKSLPRVEPVTQGPSLTLNTDAPSDLTELIGMVKGDKSGMLEGQTHSLTLEPVVPMPIAAQMPAFSSSSNLTPSSISHTSSQSMSIMAVQLPPMNADSSSSQYLVQTGDTHLPLSMNEATETKEFLLCGLCKLAFTTMEDCQSHMNAEHRELMHGLGVSIGVQVGGGKRGRKRKSDTQTVEQATKIKQEPEMDPDDLEWLPSVPEGNQTTHRDGRIRRKVIPPKALKEDYVLGRRVVKKRQRHNNSVGYNVLCPMMNCKARFKTKESMEIHLSSHNLDDASFTCPECQASHDFWKHLRIHLWKIHKIDVDLLTCDRCEYKTDTIHKMNIHKEIHADDKPYKCHVCNKGFRQAAQLKNHMVVHKNANVEESGLWFSSRRCDICERVFANSKSLTKHKEAVHAKLKPFQCSFCGHSTARKAMMELHVRTHTGEKPFKCNVCAYTTGDHNSMRRHKMRHTGEKQYRCSLCPYTCIQSISLKQHIKNKHPGVSSGIFQCTRCPFRSINQTHFESHLLDHKKGLIPDVPVTLKPNETKPKRLSLKHATGNNKHRGVTIQNGVETLFRKHPQFHAIIPGETSTQTTLEAINMGPSAGDVSTEVFNMQVTMLAGGDTQVSAEDMNRLSENPSLVALGISPLQLIYATLSTISEQIDLACVEEGRSSLLTIELIGGIQTSVLSSVQDNTVTHSITYHFPAASTVPAAATSSILTSSSGMPSQISVEEKGVHLEGDGGVGKIDSVINVEGIELLDLKAQSSSLSTLKSVASQAPQSLMVSNVFNEKEGSKVEKVGVENGESLSGNLVSSSFLTSPLPPGFISLVGTGIKINQDNLEGQEEERSVFLIENGDLVEKHISQGNVEEESGQSDDANLIVLGGKSMELAGSMVERVGGNVVTPIKPGDNSSITSTGTHTTITNLTSLLNTDQNLTMINAGSSDIMHLIPISFLDQNGQELSNAQTFIPASSC